jgi:hypothetical protein
MGTFSSSHDKILTYPIDKLLILWQHDVTVFISRIRQAEDKVRNWGHDRSFAAAESTVYCRTTAYSTPCWGRATTTATTTTTTTTTRR